jgi:hypothetical protein
METIRYRSAIVALSLAAALAGVVPTAVHADEQSGEILVTVIGVDTRRPLPGVAVTVESRSGDTYSAVTDESGSAQFEGLAAGLYRLAVMGQGLVQAIEPSVRVVARKTTPLRFEMLNSDEPLALEEVVVIADARGADPDGSVSSSYLDREALRTAVGSGSDVMRALDGLPGLISTGEFASFTVRGRGPRDNLIFVDGFPFDKVVHFDATLGDEEDIGGGGRYSIFPPNVIGGAEFSPGGWSAAYGGRSGSLLKLEVAEGNPSPSASLRIDLAGYEIGYEGPSGIDDDTSILFNARHLDFGRFFDTIEELDIGDPVLTDVLFKSVTRVGNDDTLEVLALYTPEKFDRDISHVVESPDFEDVALLHTEQDSSLLGITWRRLFGETGEWSNRIYYRTSDKVSAEGEAYPDLVPLGTPEADIPVRPEILTVGEDEAEIGWRSDLTSHNRWGRGSAGLRIRQIDLDYSTRLAEDWIRFVYDQDDFRPDQNQQYIVLTPDEIDSIYERSELSYAAYVEQLFELGRWGIRTGLRYEHDAFADQNLLSPRVAINWDYSPDLRFSATAGVFYQSPLFLDQASDPGNAGLENERITHFSVGVERILAGDWTLMIETYYQLLDDLVVEQDGASGTASNAGEGTSYGADLVLTRRFADRWSANATYSYNNARHDNNDGMGEFDAEFNREHVFTVGAQWEISDRWLVGARWKYLTGRPTDAFIIHEDVLDGGQPLRYSKEITQWNVNRADDFSLLNVRVDYRRPLGPVDVVAFLDVVNLYGADNSDALEFDPRRGVNVVESGEMTPFIGLRFELTW